MTTAVAWFRRDLRLSDNPALLDALAVGDDVVALFVLDDALWRPAGPPAVPSSPGASARSTSRPAAASSSGAATRRTWYREVAAEVGATPCTPPRTSARTADGVIVPSPARSPRPGPSCCSSERLRRGAGNAPHEGGHAVPGVQPVRQGLAGTRMGAAVRRRHDRRPGSTGCTATAYPSRLASTPPFRRPGRRQPSGPPAGSGTVTSTATTSSATSPRPTPHPGCRRTCAGAACTRGSSWPSSAPIDRPVGSGTNCAGASSTPTSCCTIRRRHGGHGSLGCGRSASTKAASADDRFAAWAEGRTGFPLVDAGMRQLAAEAWMHNRVRMVVASFLVKDLHVDWSRGARWFMQHLVDGDLASNSHGWQWVAGTGTDPSPFVRVFNPVDAVEAVRRRWRLHPAMGTGAPRVSRRRRSTSRGSSRVDRRRGTRCRSSTTPPSGRRRWPATARPDVHELDRVEPVERIGVRLGGDAYPDDHWSRVGEVVGRFCRVRCRGSGLPARAMVPTPQEPTSESSIRKDTHGAQRVLARGSRRARPSCSR